MARHPDRTASPTRARVAMRRTALALTIAGVIGLAGCTNAGPVTPTGSAPATSASPSATPTPTPTSTAAPVLVPDGTAADNLPLFTAVTLKTWGSLEQAAGRVYIDALVAAGFDKSAMQVTRDLSTVGNPAESLQFSVRWGQECLVGQVGPAIGDPFTVVVPALPDGSCLVGETRPIDW